LPGGEAAYSNRSRIRNWNCRGAEELTGTGVGGARAASSRREEARLVTGAGEGVGVGA
jgi:hypothetical protein